MQRLTERAHELCQAKIAPGDVVVDATAGNGHDTLFLGQCVGASGTVYAFDRQADAIRATARRLESAELKNAVLLQVDHANLQASIPREHHGRIAAVMFNLGYLPGGDKTVITSATSTLPAIEQSLDLFRSGGILTVLCYPGHPGGDEETAAVRTLLRSLPAETYDVKEYVALESNTAPVLLAAQKR